MILTRCPTVEGTVSDCPYYRPMQVLDHVRNTVTDKRVAVLVRQT